MFESKNVKAVGKIATIDGVWETRHQVAAHALLDDSPTFGPFKDHSNRSFRFIEKPKRPASPRGFRNIRAASISSLSASGWYISRIRARVALLA
jgi:hypothetical protein